MTQVTVAFTNEARWFHRFFQQLFQTYLPNFVIIQADPNRPPHLLFFSIFGPDHKQFFRNNNKTKFVLICGEPADLSKYTFCSLIIDCKNVPSLRPLGVPFVYLPFYITSFGERYINRYDELFITKNQDIKSKSKFCAFMYSQEVEFRNTLFDMLNNYKRVDALGKCRHNMDGKIDRHFYEVGKKTYNDLAVEKYRPYKFVLAIENSRHPGYVTEKIINPMLAGSIPIYYGAPDIVQHFNPKSFIRIDDFASFEDAIQYIKQVDQNDDLYQAYLKEPWFSMSNETIKSLFQGQSIVNHLSKIGTPSINHQHHQRHQHHQHQHHQKFSNHHHRQNFARQPTFFFRYPTRTYQHQRPKIMMQQQTRFLSGPLSFQQRLKLRSNLNRSFLSVRGGSGTTKLRQTQFTKRSNQRRKGI
jgi:hypothetical protein